MWRRIERAISFIIKYPPGKSIVAKSYANKACKKISGEVQVLFPLAFALHSLSLVPKNKLNTSAKNWIDKAVDYIEKQENDFSFNYWIRKSESALKRPLPDDLDDTAFGLTALIKHDLDISEKYFLKLLNLEEDEGGPYRTWYLRMDSPNKSIKKWVDVDPVVNANFYYFIKLYGINLPKTRTYLIDCLKSSKFSSPYYPYDLFFVYSLSRSAGFSEDTELKNYILKNLQSYELNSLEPMEKLLYSLSLAHLGETVGQALLTDILSLQQEDGSLQPLPFCYDGLSLNILTITSNSVFTTALFLELLLLIYLQNTKEKSNSRNSLLDRLNKLQEKIIKNEMHQLLSVQEFKKGLHDKGFHTPLGTVSAAALSLKTNMTKDDLEIISDLSTAVHFAWSGYTVDDEILDNQRRIDDIPLANALKRIGWKYYYKIIRKVPKFENQIIEAFRACDENYVWEIHNAKFDKTNLNTILKAKLDVDYIERRMQPYLISMKYVPILIGVDESKAEYVYNFYRSQIIIKQVDDDAHDWAEDNDAGIMTYVLYLLYKENKNPKTHQSVFWDKVIFKITEICEIEYEKALVALKKLDLNNDFMTELLNKTYGSILKAKEEREKAGRILVGVKDLGLK